MTRLEYNNTLRDLLGDDSRPASTWVLEGSASGFDNDVNAQNVEATQVEQYRVAAEAAAERAVAKLERLLPCDPSGMGEATCGAAFIEQFASRAFRRPLSSEERARLEAIFNVGLSSAGFVNGVRLVIETTLQSPSFLYRIERGYAAGVGGSADGLLLTDHEIASRLSYLLLGSLPDDALLSAAAAGVLHTPAQIAEHADRLLKDPRARDVLSHFHSQWLKTEQLPDIVRDPEAYPSFGAATGKALQLGLDAFLSHVYLDSAIGNIQELFNADYAFANAVTAPLYDLPGIEGASFQRVPLDPAKRAGFLTDPAIMTASANPTGSNPIRRGLLVREQLLCQTLPQPPPGTPSLPQEKPRNLTTRQFFERHRSNPSCNACHQMIDSLGFGFENYGAIGEYRATEDGVPIDASGELLGTETADGKFAGATALASKLATTQEVSDCVALQWFRFATGRMEEPDDACAIDDLRARFAAGGYRLRDLIIALTQGSEFRARPAIDTSDSGECSP